MEDLNGSAGNLGEPGRRIWHLRLAGGVSRRQLAKRSGLSRGTIAALERGRRQPSPDELTRIAAACGVEPGSLTPAREGELTLAVVGSSRGAMVAVRGEAAFDALLREYLSMVVELRSNRRASAESLRQGDLSELARALGDTPEAIEGRLMQLLGSDHDAASELRAAITPSFGVAPSAPLQ